VKKKAVHSDKMSKKILTGGRDVGQLGWNNAAVKFSTCA